MSKVAILVTGGAGYIGAHACKAIAAAGFLPVAFDNLVYGHREAIQWGPLEVGDIADRARLDEVLVAHDCAAVMHFAAFAFVGESIADPGKYYRNNVIGTLSLLETMRDRGIDKLIFSSSCATYGLPERVPMNEHTPQTPINPYGQSKLMCERMIGDFVRAHGLNATILRYFNAAGADADGDIGECHEPETHLIPLAIQAVAGQGPALTVFGQDYDTPDGTCIRDYIHVTDLADAHVRALGRLGTAGRCEAFNLGTGSGVSVREIISAVEQAGGRPVPHQFGPRREGDPAVLVADASRAHAELGWRATHSDVKTIASTAWAWHEKCHG